MQSEGRILFAGKRSAYGRQKGQIADVMTAGICVIAMTVIMMAYIGSVQLLDRKTQIDQVARKYILRMETLGYLSENDKLQLSWELQQLGSYELVFDGTTLDRVGYGEPITLVVCGKINSSGVDMQDGLFGKVADQIVCEFEERRMSTAKN